MNAGVGLAGMQERVRDLGGQFAIQPCEPGIQIAATIPLSKGTLDTAASAGDGPQVGK
jgi:glucose-6-phosphate-specific signal transduction histidine kinase